MYHLATAALAASASAGPNTPAMTRSWVVGASVANINWLTRATRDTVTGDIPPTGTALWCTKHKCTGFVAPSFKQYDLFVESIMFS